MSYKRFLAVFAVIAAALVLFVSVFMYFVDPLFYFRKPKLYKPQYIANARYQMPGLLKNMDYDTIFTATSMGKNFWESYADKVLGAKTFNASLPASTAHEQSMVAQAAFQDKPKLKRVIWELNYYSFSGNPDWVSPPPADFPTWMYDKSKINDIRYLFSSYSVKILYKNLMANRTGDQRWRDVESLYKFGQVAPIENLKHIQTILNNVQPREKVPDYQKSSSLLKSFKENVLSLIKAHPNTKFTLFFAPYAVYNQEVFYKENPDYLTERLKFKKEVYELIRKYPNVELYDFQDMKNITFNIGNYEGDTIHYYYFINNWILNYFAHHPPVQSQAEYDTMLNNLKQQIVHFNIDQLKTKSPFKQKYSFK